MANWEEIVGTNIRRIRQDRDLTQAQLAKSARVTVRHLGRIERGEGNPSVQVLGRIARALKIHPRVLFEADKAG